MPEFKSFFNPTLEFFYDGHTHTKKEVSVFNVKYFDLDDDELKETTSKGSSFKYRNRSEWDVLICIMQSFLKGKKEAYIL